MTQIWHLSHVSLLILTFYLPAGDVWFKPFAEIHRTHDGVDDSCNDKDDGNDGEGSKRPADRKECLLEFGLVHPDKLEEEVGQGDKIKRLKIN